MIDSTRHLRLLVTLLLAFVITGCGEEVAGTDSERDGGLDAGITTDSDDSVRSDDVASDPPDSSAADVDAATKPSGPFPVVLAHGMFGFAHLANVEELPYYYGVAEMLIERGEDVFVPAVSPLADSDVRGARLLEAIEEYLADTGHPKVNIIGHSQGGLDARWVAHERPDLVASVVTISTPHGGTPVADIVLQLTDNRWFQDVVDAMVRLAGKPLYDELGNESSLFAPLRLFSEPGIEAFNQRITDRPGVYYASVAGRTGGQPGGIECVALDPPQFIRDWEGVLDPVDATLFVTESVLDRPNDGLVPVEKAMWGEFLGCIPADHMDEVGQLLGDSPGFGNNWDHVKFYGDLVEHLRARGL